MICDLKSMGQIVQEADFLVIGAGTVGLPTSVMLAEQTGRSVICLESGGLQQSAAHHPLNAVASDNGAYKSPSDGRFRCLGGSSSRWGGAVLPFQGVDLRNAGWPIGIDDLAPYFATVEDLFSLPDRHPQQEQPSGSPALVTRYARMPRFANRNVARLLSGRARAAKKLQVWLQAHVTAIHPMVEGVTVRAANRDGSTLTIRARKLIIAAGAIETTRLALLLDRRSNGAISSLTPHLGKNLSDHLPFDVGEIDSVAPRALNRMIGIHFDARGTMRKPRLELAADALQRQTIPPVFFEFHFEHNNANGSEALRQFLRLMQRSKLPPFALLADMATHAPWILRAAWWRLIERRVLFPEQSTLMLRAVVEQRPDPSNRITLSDQHHDLFGQPMAHVSWHISPNHKQDMRQAASLLRQEWDKLHVASYGRLKPASSAEIDYRISQCGGYFHPTGTTRMASRPQDGVVDSNLRLFGIPDVQLLSTAVLPSSGGANPTMMVLLLAARLVRQHALATNRVSTPVNRFTLARGHSVANPNRRRRCA